MISNSRATRALGFAAAGILALALASCAGDEAPATGSPFSQALYKDYTDLSAQAAAAPSAESEGSFFSDPFGLVSMFSGSSDPKDLLVTAFTDKANLAEQGQEPAPEAASSDPTAQTMRGRLIRAIAAGKTSVPDQAARAQADYDCWILDSNVAALASASQACRTALDGSLLALENAARPAPPPPPPVAQIAPPVAPTAAPPPPPPAPTSNFTVYFNFDSWTLTAEDLTVITTVINTARAGGQSHITVVGHTDTSGPADYNQRLSVRRANVVVEALVDMGARRAAIQASGVGKNDLAVQTPDNTKEARNRRSVVSLLP
ncbi:MAG TPA: OmpA family protein [Rhizomicrobium sp.]|nr:OmpA family protein [Rhizomicrobium sp.]